jgi:hypothetical protein
LTSSRSEPSAAWVSAWLIERPSNEPGRPLYWVESIAAKGLGDWTQDPWRATHYETREQAERELRRWAVHPTITEAKAVEHGFG